MNNIAGALYRVIKIKTKWSAAGEWGQCHASVSSNSHVFKRLRKVSSDGDLVILWSSEVNTGIRLLGTKTKFKAYVVYNSFIGRLLTAFVFFTSKTFLSVAQFLCYSWFIKYH